MAWFVLEFRREGYTTTELEEFPLLETALKYGADDLALMGRERPLSIGVGQANGADVDWLGELRLDAHGRPSWAPAPPLKRAS